MSVTTELGDTAHIDTQGFCYDEQDRLIWAGSTGTPPTGCQLPATPSSFGSAGYQHLYSYDTLGRLTSGALGTYNYGDPTHHLHAATAIGSSWTAGYDAAGNMTCRAPTNAASCAGTPTGSQLAYAADGSLTTWQNAPTNPTATASFLYDGHGNRVAQQVTQSGATTTTDYVRNLEQLITVGNTTTTQTYYYANGKRFAMAAGGSFSYLAGDGVGSIEMAAAGSSPSYALFDPYGQLRYSSGTMPTDYGFTGQHADGTSALDYYNARYYDPLAGQFISADSTLPGNGYDMWGLSRYAYVEGNPETLTDPSGDTVCRAGHGCGAGWSGEEDPAAAVQAVPTSNDAPSVATSGFPVASRPADATNPSIFQRALANGTDIVYNPPPWVCALPGVCANAFLMQLLNDVPDDQQQALVFVTAGVSGEVGAEASFLRAERTLLAAERTAGAGTAGLAIIGSYPKYINVADAVGGRAFSVPKGIWDSMSTAEKEAANLRFLDRGIGRRDSFLVVTQGKVGRGLSFEIGYLRANGYEWTTNGLGLVPPPE